MFMFSLIIIEFDVKIYRIRIYYFQAGVSQTVKSTKTKTCIPVFIPKTVVSKKKWQYLSVLKNTFQLHTGM